MLCAPVTYVSDARRLAKFPINECANPPFWGAWGARERRFGTSPPCSKTAIIPGTSVPSFRLVNR
jgi:hypothetical protein